MEFRKAFAKIGEVRSLIPSNVNVMALTATATISTRTHVCEKLSMVNPVVISQSPNKLNIKYIVHKKEASISDIIAPLANELKQHRKSLPRVIIFGKTYEACGEVYLYFKKHLGKESTEPVSAPNLACFLLVDMYTACTTKDVKDSIVKSFCKPNGTLRIVVATVAFGMAWIAQMFVLSFTLEHRLMLKLIFKKQAVLGGTELRRLLFFTIVRRTLLSLRQMTTP